MPEDRVGELSLEAAISCVGIFSTKTIEAMSAEHWTPDAKFQEIISNVIRKALAEAESRVQTTVCEETGRQAVDGECPVHHGDACLYDVAQMRDYVNGATGLRDKHAKKVVEMFNETERIKAKLEKAQGHLQEIRKEPNNQMTWGEWYNRVLEIAEKANKEIGDA